MTELYRLDAGWMLNDAQHKHQKMKSRKCVDGFCVPLNVISAWYGDVCDIIRCVVYDSTWQRAGSVAELAHHWGPNDLPEANFSIGLDCWIKVQMHSGGGRFATTDFLREQIRDSDVRCVTNMHYIIINSFYTAATAGRVHGKQKLCGRQ